MSNSRVSGVLLHPTSLPGRFGIGDLGPAAFRFADFLAEAGQRLWQVLPLGPTGYGDSPYQCFSAFAGNPLLISLEKLVSDGWLTPADLDNTPDFPTRYVDFEQVIPYRFELLGRAYLNFATRASDESLVDFSRFCANETGWLDGYARFMALREAAGGGSIWTEWDPDLEAPEDRVAAHKFWQYLFFHQWHSLKAYCAHRGIRLVGDMPIYVAHDSADVWQHRDLFRLDDRGRPLAVAGVPPDYFSATGQLWGNPIYRWDVLAETGFQWWIDRFDAAFSMVDLVRLDHFRGFQAYWEVPFPAETAVEGHWVPGPGAALFAALEDALGDLPIIAENLGVITEEVEALRARFGFPGMSVLQFAFGNDPQAHTFRPHNYTPHLVAYTGTHDNDTTIGWWSATGTDSTRSPADVARERSFARDYLAIRGDEPVQWAFIRALMASVAATVIIPLQDILGLGSEARMNHPGRSNGNWAWRFEPDALSASCATTLRRLTNLYER